MEILRKLPKEILGTLLGPILRKLPGTILRKQLRRYYGKYYGNTRVRTRHSFVTFVSRLLAVVASLPAS